MQMRQFALCWVDPEGNRTGYTILKTFNTYRQARQHLARCTSRGLYIAERKGNGKGANYVRYVKPAEEE